jgi:hypothetical protein
MSVADLRNIVVGRLPEGTPIPSAEWVRLQFWSSNPYATVAVYGGPDHQLTYGSVQVSLFLRLYLDMIVAVRCAPHQSLVLKGDSQLGIAECCIAA